MTLSRPLISSPGHQVSRADGSRAWLASDGIVVVENRETKRFEVTVPDLAEVIYIEADEIQRAAAGVPNLIAARVHDARQAQGLHQLDYDDPVHEQLAVMLANAFKIVRNSVVQTNRKLV